MTKEQFIEVLKKKGFTNVGMDDNIPTVTLVGADKKEVKRNYISVGLIAKKVGYTHSFRVKNLEEVNDEHTAQNS